MQPDERTETTASYHDVTMRLARACRISYYPAAADVEIVRRHAATEAEARATLEAWIAERA